MICQAFDWLFDSAGPTTLQYALVGMICLLAYDAVVRWRKRRSAAATADRTAGETLQPDQPIEQRRAA